LVCMDARAVAGMACVAPGALREAGALGAACAAGKEKAKRGAAASGKRARSGPADARGSAADGAPSSDALAAFAKVVKCAQGSRLLPASQPPDAQAACNAQPLHLISRVCNLGCSHSASPTRYVCTAWWESADTAWCPARPATAPRRPAAARCCWRTSASACRGAAAPAATCAGILQPSPCRSAAPRLLLPHDVQGLLKGSRWQEACGGAASAGDVGKLDLQLAKRVGVVLNDINACN